MDGTVVEAANDKMAPFLTIPSPRNELRLSKRGTSYLPMTEIESQSNNCDATKDSIDKAKCKPFITPVSSPDIKP